MFFDVDDDDDDDDNNNPLKMRNNNDLDFALKLKAHTLDYTEKIKTGVIVVQ